MRFWLRKNRFAYFRFCDIIFWHDNRFIIRDEEESPNTPVAIRRQVAGNTRRNSNVIEVRAETSQTKVSEFLSGIVGMATYRVKRPNPYSRARSCSVMREPHEVSGNTYPRYMIILSLLRQNSAYVHTNTPVIGVFVFMLQCQKQVCYER